MNKLATTEKFSVAQKDGKRFVTKDIIYYNLDVAYLPDNTKRIGDNALVALTIMISESKSEEKDTMVKVVINLIIIKMNSPIIYLRT